MKKLTLWYMFISILLLGIVTAINFIPSGSINGIDIYNITNFLQINSTEFFQNGNAVLDSSTSGINTSFNETRTNALYILLTSEGNLNVNGSTNWDSETSQANLNVNSSTWWATASNFVTNWLIKTGNNLDYNETKLNVSINDIVITANTSLKNYVDAQDVIFNNSMKVYVDGTFITQANEANLNVNTSNSTEYWDDLDDPTEIITMGSFTANQINATGAVSYFKELNGTINASNIDNLDINCGVSTFVTGVNASNESIICSSVTGFLSDTGDNTATANYSITGNFNATEFFQGNNAVLDSSGISIATNIETSANSTAAFFKGDGSLLSNLPSENATWNETKAKSIFIDNTGDNGTGAYNLTGGNMTLGTLFVQNKTGFVGINISEPKTILDIKGRNSTLRLTDSKNGDWGELEGIAGINAFTNDLSGSGIGVIAKLRFVNTDGTTSPEGAFLFVVRESTAASFLNAMIIKSNGKVGINTITPGVSLQVNGTIRAATSSGQGILSLGEETNGSIITVGAWRGLSNSLSYGNILNFGGYDGIAFSAGNAVIGSQTQVMFINTTGSIGIGITNPRNLLDVFRNASAVVKIKLTNEFARDVAKGPAPHVLFEASDEFSSLFVGLWPAGHSTPILTNSSAIFTDRSGGLALISTHADGKIKFATAGDVEVMNIDEDGVLNVVDLAGTYTGGNATVCVYDNGTIYARDNPTC